MARQSSSRKRHFLIICPTIFILLFYPWLIDIIFLCSNVLLSLSFLLEFRTAHAIRDMAIYIPTFPFPLTSPSNILLRKELRTMALPTKSWPRASEDWITWVDKLSPHFQEHWESLGIAQFIKLPKVSITLDLDLISATQSIKTIFKLPFFFFP